MRLGVGYAKQQSLQTKINNSFHNFKSKGKDNMTVGNAQACLAGLEKNYTIFQTTHEKIMHLKEFYKKHAHFTSNLVDLVEDSFYDRKGEFLDFLKNLREKKCCRRGFDLRCCDSSKPCAIHKCFISVIAKSRFTKIFW